MHNSINNELFDSIIKLACNEYIKTEFDSFPSDADLESAYPMPKKELRFARRIDRQRKGKHSLIFVWGQRVAVIFLVFATLTFSILMTDTEIRSAVCERVIEWFEKYAVFNFANVPAHEEDKDFDINNIRIGYIPEGYELAEETEYEKHVFQRYIDKKDNNILIEIYLTNMAITNADSEYHSYKQIKINNYEGYLLSRADVNDRIITYGNKSFTVIITATTITENELIKIAEKIIC